MTKGFIVGCDKEQEWLLPWWLDNFTRHNWHDVVVFDFGMSKRMRRKASAWFDRVIGLRTLSKGWFNKPVAIAASPFDLSVWMDLDCEVRGDLGGLFYHASKGFAVAPDKYARSLPSVREQPWAKDAWFNSGVVAFSKQSPVPREWLSAMAGRGTIRGDQEVLASIWPKVEKRVYALPRKYNNLRLEGLKDDALVWHHTGPLGKMHIRNLIEENRV